jgi:hypothetical protein
VEDTFYLQDIFLKLYKEGNRAHDIAVNSYRVKSNIMKGQIGIRIASR